MREREIAVSVKDIHKNFILSQNTKNTSLKTMAVNIVRKTTSRP